MVKEHKASISRACRVAQIDRKTYHNQAKRKKDDDMIETLLKDLSAQYPRYGFEKLFSMLRNKGHLYNHKRVRRIYCALELNLKVKPKKRLAPQTKVALEQPSELNKCWSLDYMSDALVTGRRFRTANVIDDCNRGAIGILASHSLPSLRITNWLDRLAEVKGYPDTIRVDNGPENISKHFQKWASERNIHIRYIQPGKPAQNAYIERFNRTYREAILDMYLFKNVQEVQALTDNWIKHYNEERPHEALNNLTPKHFERQLQQNYSIF